MLIRPYDSHDRQHILDILHESGTFTKEEVAVALEVIDDAWSYPNRGDYLIICAEDGPDTVTGYLCYGPIPMTDRCYDLYWICVDKTHKRSGVGTALMLEMESSLKSLNARRVYIDTSSTFPYNDARSFYEKHGYRKVSMLSDYYSVGDDKIIYMKEIVADPLSFTA